jgi:hypothetical protein
MDLLYFTLAFGAMLIAAWIIARSSLGPQAASVYLSPFVSIFLRRWFVWSVVLACVMFFFFSWFPALLRESPKESVPKEPPNADQIHLTSPARGPGRLLRWVMVVAACLGVLGMLAYRIAYLGDLVETISFPGTTHPSVEIRRTGFLQSSLEMFLVGPLYKQGICSLPGQFNVRDASHLPPRQGTGEVRMGREEHEPFGITWSDDGRRLAVVFKGNYVAAYDLDTGETLGWSGSSTDKTVELFLSGNRDASPAASALLRFHPARITNMNNSLPSLERKRDAEGGLTGRGESIPVTLRNQAHRQ